MLSDERQRMMQDMHDGLGSTLISAIRSVEHGGMSDERVTQTLKDCMDDLKLAIDSMEPVEADLLLLLATLRFRLEPRLEDTGVALLWEVQELPTLGWLDPSSALHILRIVQESVANILRHTRATEIRVGTAVQGDGVQVSIEDNGQGFDVAKALGEATARACTTSSGARRCWEAGWNGNQVLKARALSCGCRWSPLPVLPESRICPPLGEGARAAVKRFSRFPGRAWKPARGYGHSSRGHPPCCHVCAASGKSCPGR
jgi:hypothetical protein